jgi:hypothetical protein
VATSKGVFLVNEIPNQSEKAIAATLILEAVGKASAMLDSFSGWLLGGFAAAVALLIAQLSSLTKYISLSTIRGCLVLFIISVITALIQKYISSAIQAASQSATAARDILVKEPFSNFVPSLRLDVFLSEVERAIFFPVRLLVRRSFEKIRQGDLTAGAINFARWAQIQGYLVLFQSILLLGAILTILLSLKLFVDKVVPGAVGPW